MLKSKQKKYLSPAGIEITHTSKEGRDRENGVEMRTYDDYGTAFFSLNYLKAIQGWLVG